MSTFASPEPPNDLAHGAAGRLLETKLYTPRARSALVERARLTERLRHGVERKLTIVVAPAGFGKTTLLATWLAQAPDGSRPVAWVSLEASENEPSRFWAYVVRALQRRNPALGAHALAQLQSPRPPAIEAVLTPLINEIDALDGETILVLDDFHAVDSAVVHGQVAFLLDHLPRRMHVVIASRAEPPLPLARMRARGELTELRASDLRFTHGESTEFLNRIMALGLSSADTARLEQRTEGWITGLKLAALSLQRGGDARGFVDAFSGDDRYVADYLVDEILAAEPEVVRRFLLDTAILDRLSGALCDAVIDAAGSQATLEALERRGLFVVSLDDRREWFRYHHLFAEVLQRHALRADRERSRTCHRRASAWYERNGDAEDAVRHALGASDVERAAGMLESAWPEKDRSYESVRWLARVKSLPDAVIRARPVLSMGYAWALLNGGELEAAEPRLRDVEGWLAAAGDAVDRDAVPVSTMVVTDEARFRTLPIELASARLYLTQARGELPSTVEQARRALDRIPADDLTARSTGTALLGLALWGHGALESAYHTFAEALSLMQASGNALSTVRGTFVLADIRVVQGRLREAQAIYERGLRLAEEQGSAESTETDELHLGLCELDREWNDLAAAHDRLQRLTTSAERSAHAGNRQRWCIAMARVREAEGDLTGALALLEEAEAHDIRTPMPRIRPIDAMKVRLRVAQGRLAEVADWERAHAWTPDDAHTYLREFESLTLARILLARAETVGDRQAALDALALLDRLRRAAEDGGRAGSVIEATMLEALARRALGDVRGAVGALGRALTPAEPEGYVRIFLDEGSRMRDLLRHAVARGTGGEYARRLLAAFDASSMSKAGGPPSPGAGARVTQRGADPLSSNAMTPRELEVLRLIAGGLRNQEIAEHLSISHATVKRHVANAYAKLGAGHRTEALVRAKELGLL